GLELAGEAHLTVGFDLGGGERPGDRLPDRHLQRSAGGAEVHRAFAEQKALLVVAGWPKGEADLAGGRGRAGGQRRPRGTACRPCLQLDLLVRQTTTGVGPFEGGGQLGLSSVPDRARRQRGGQRGGGEFRLLRRAR